MKSALAARARRVPDAEVDGAPVLVVRPEGREQLEDLIAELLIADLEADEARAGNAAR
jgi:hypothetical protein